MLLEERTGQAVTEAEAEKLAHELYGLMVAAKSLPGEYDDNFHLTNEKAGVEAAGRAAAAASFVLKVMHPARERDKDSAERVEPAPELAARAAVDRRTAT